MKRNEENSTDTGRQIIDDLLEPVHKGVISAEEKILLRQLVSDRIENRFVFAGKAASEMNSIRLLAAAQEIKGLEALREKLS